MKKVFITDTPIKPAKEELDVIELIKFVSDNKLDKDPRICALLKSLSLNPSDKERKEQLLRMIKPHIIHTFISDDPFRPHPQDDEVNGEIKLGTCAETSAVFGLNLEELVQGTLIVGRPGAGKTTLTYNLIEGANKLGIHCLILDIKKDYRHLIRNLPNTLVFRADDPDFRWNPLQVPAEVGRVSHISNFADITSESFTVFDGTNNYLVQHLNRIYQQYKQPTPADLYAAIENDKPPQNSREARYRESAMNRLGSVMVKMGRNFRYKTGYKLEELIDSYNIIVEIDNLGDKAGIYLSSLILSQVFQYRIENNRRGIKQKPALVIMDEGNELFNKKLEEQMGGLTLVSMTRQAREFQLGIVCSCQLPNAISDTVKNVYTRVLLNLPEGSNLRIMRQSMGLDEEQEKANFSLLPGQAIVRLAGKYDKPFLVQFDDHPISKDVSNEEVKQHMQPFIASQPPEAEQEPAVEVASEQEKYSNDEVTDFLEKIYHDPFLTLTQRYRHHKLTNDKGRRLKRWLVEVKTYCVSIVIDVGGRGRKPEYLALTKDGLARIEKKDNWKYNPSNFEHSYWQNRIHELFEGYNPEKEKTVAIRGRDRKIDVAIVCDGKLWAFEVAMTPDYERQNIEKDLEGGCEKVFICCKDKKVLSEVKQIIDSLQPEQAAKVKALLLKEIIKLSPEKVLV